jgi:hypothetical protein
MENPPPPPKILLYGNSILIESLAFKLKQTTGWEVKRIESGEVRDVSDVEYLVTDLGDLSISQALPMLSALPGIMLIGMDAIANSLTVLTGRSHPSLNLEMVLDTLKKAL